MLRIGQSVTDCFPVFLLDDRWLGVSVDDCLVISMTDAI